jgi:predicted peptidase
MSINKTKMKNSKVKSIVLFLTLSFSMSLNNTYAQTSRFSFNQLTNDKGDTMKYRLLYPDYDTLRKYPLVIFLHGSGERGNDNEAQLKWGVMNFATDQMMIMHPAFILAPQCPANQSWANYNNKNKSELRLNSVPSQPMGLLIELIHKLIKELAIDTNRIYITGLSMGGYGTFDAIERYPHLFAAAVPVCGGGDVSKAALIAHIPIWIFHGSEDAAVNPILSLNMADALTKAGGHPGFTLYPEVGHYSWLGTYTDPLLMDWLFRQKK